MVLSVVLKVPDSVIALLSEEIWLSYQQRGIISEVSLWVN